MPPGRRILEIDCGARAAGAAIRLGSSDSGNGCMWVTMPRSSLNAIETVIAEWKLSNLREALRSIFSWPLNVSHIQSA